MSNLKIAILRVGIYKTCIPITYVYIYIFIYVYIYIYTYTHPDVHVYAYTHTNSTHISYIHRERTLRFKLIVVYP